jgi:hypothetical protein
MYGTLGKSKQQCESLLQGFSERLDRAFTMVQDLEDGQIKAVDTTRYSETAELVQTIVADLNREASLAHRDNADAFMSLVESAVYFPAITQAAAYFTLDLTSKQSREWHDHLYNASIDMTYALEQIESF